MIHGPDLTLKRFSIDDDGAFGYLTRDINSEQVAVTCERTFGADDEPTVVIPPGVYRCVRGVHSLDGVHRFETYEITGIPGHSGLLFHTGNTEMDSKGCVLLGKHFGQMGDVMAVLDSRVAFRDFMDLMNLADVFQLTVKAS